MHHSRLCAVLIDCKTSSIDEAARFWGEALGRAVDSKHPGTRGNYRMLETPPDEPIVQIQRVDHESRVHVDIETDDIPAEVTRLERLGAKVIDRLERWAPRDNGDGHHPRRGDPPGEAGREGHRPPRALGGDAGAHRATLLRCTGTASRFPEECQPLGLSRLAPPLALTAPWACRKT